jgi:hypothetical protein
MSTPQPSPHFSNLFYRGRLSARRDGPYTLLPARRRVSYAFAVAQSVRPTRTAYQRPRDEQV